MVLRRSIRSLMSISLKVPAGTVGGSTTVSARVNRDEQEKQYKESLLGPSERREGSCFKFQLVHHKGLRTDSQLFKVMNKRTDG